jgi:hypothetical protein
MATRTDNNTIPPARFHPTPQAVAVAQTAITEKLARNFTPADIPFLEGIIQRKMYDPVYVPLVPVY